jgi:hypothetical protein
LDDVAALAGTKDPETEARQFVVPDDVVLLSALRRLDNPLCDLDHDVPSFRAPFSRVSRMSAGGRKLVRVSDRNVAVFVENI